MKILISNLTVILLCFFLSGKISAQVNDAGNTYCNKGSHADDHWKFEEAGLRDDNNFDLKHYLFDWYIDPAVYQIKGSASPSLVITGTAVSRLNFNLSSSLSVDSVLMDGSELTYTQGGSFDLNIFLPRDYNTGESLTLNIYYHGVPPSGGLGSFIKDKHNNTDVIWTLSEPYGSQDWWPCKNGLTDKIDSIDVVVHTPNQYRVASNGMLEEEIEKDSLTTFHWKHRYPIAPYLVAIAVTNYDRYTDTVHLSNGTVLPMVNYVYPESLQDAKKGTADLVAVLEYFDSLFVTYPYYKEKYGHAQFGWGGGMEHQTMSYVIHFGFSLLSHELAHQWFGDMVTCGSWEDIWLNEGFATYLEGLSQYRINGASAFNSWKLGKINSVTSQAGGSVKVSDVTNIGRIFSGRLSYNKGSYLLHMLRWKLGDELFFSGLRNYLHARQYNFGTTQELKQELELVSGYDLTEFFEDWYEGQGFPTYNITYQGKGNTLLLKVNQVASHVVC